MRLETGMSQITVQDETIDSIRLDFVVAADLGQAFFLGVIVTKSAAGTTNKSDLNGAVKFCMSEYKGGGI